MEKEKKKMIYVQLDAQETFDLPDGYSTTNNIYEAEEIWILDGKLPNPSLISAIESLGIPVKTKHHQLGRERNLDRGFEP